MIYVLSEIMGILIALLGLIILYNVQTTVNDIWAKKLPTLKLSEKYSEGEIVIIVIGIVFWVLSFIGIFLSFAGFEPG